MSTDGGTVGIKAIPDFEGFGNLFSQGIRGALVQAQGLGKQVGSALGGGVKSAVILGTAGAAIAIGDFVASGVREYERLGAQTLALQHVTGASAEQASTFASVISHLGGTVEGVTRGLGIFGANIAQQPELFQKYGVAIAFAADGSQNLLGTLDNLRQKFQADGNVTERNAEAKKLLGRSYQTLLPYLNLTNEQFAIFERLARQSGQVLSQQDVDRARELAIQMREVGDRIESVKVAVGRDAAGFLSNFFSGTDVIANETSAFAKLRDVVGGIFGRDWSSASARQAANDIATAGHAAAEAAIAFDNLQKAEDGIQSAAEGVKSADQGLADAKDGVIKANEGVTRAEQGVASAHHSTQQATAGLADAQYNLNQLLQKGAVDAKAVESAERGVESANRSVRDATESLTAAQQNLNDVQVGATATELTDAHLSLASATLALAEARRSLGTARNTSTDPFAQQRARLSVEQAVENQKKAQDALTQTQQKGTDADKNLTDAQRQVRDASERVTDAIRSQDDAEKALRDAQAGDPEFQHKVAAAKDAVAQAAYGVQQAEQNEGAAAQGLRDAHDQVTKAEQGVEDASYKATVAHDKLAAAIESARANGVGLGQVVDDLIAKYPQLAGVLNALTAPLPIHYQAPGASIPIDATYDPKTNTLHLPGKASGGDVRPGQAYWVGEQGPEIFQDGHIYPSGQTPRPVGNDGGSMAGAHSHPIYLNGRLVGEAMAEDMTVAQARYRKGTRGRV